MTHKNRFFWVTLIALQTACTQNPVKQTVVKKTPLPHVSSAKAVHTDSESVVYKNEPITAEQASVSGSAVSAFENKPRPVLSPAAQSLLASAEKSTKDGDLDSASATLERALRISPRNAELTYQLAALRLKQSQPRLAEDLGKKAALLSTNDRELKKRCWQLIAQAREVLGNSQGAREAQLKADNVEAGN